MIDCITDLLYGVDLRQVVMNTLVLHLLPHRYTLQRLLLSGVQTESAFHILVYPGGKECKGGHLCTIWLVCFVVQFHISKQKAVQGQYNGVSDRCFEEEKDVVSRDLALVTSSLVCYQGVHSKGNILQTRFVSHQNKWSILKYTDIHKSKYSLNQMMFAIKREFLLSGKLLEVCHTQ
jgi:hypothetical protein